MDLTSERKCSLKVCERIKFFTHGSQKGEKAHNIPRLSSSVMDWKGEKHSLKACE